MYEKRIMLIAGLVLAGMLFIISRFPLAGELPDVIELNDFVAIYDPVEFDHAMHMDMTSCADCHHQTTGEPVENAKCQACHRESENFKNVSCNGCHPQDPVTAFIVKTGSEPILFHTEKTGLKRVYHMKCLGCHREMDVYNGCQDCHPKKEITGNRAETES